MSEYCEQHTNYKLPCPYCEIERLIAELAVCQKQINEDNKWEATLRQRAEAAERELAAYEAAVKVDGTIDIIHTNGTFKHISMPWQDKTLDAFSEGQTVTVLVLGRADP